MKLNNPINFGNGDKGSVPTGRRQEKETSNIHVTGCFLKVKIKWT
jgi:hypothetical protein